MAPIIFIILLLAVWHYVYESILMPIFRHNLRYRFFALRDELRLLKLDKGDELDNHVFYLVDESISSMIKNLAFINLSFVIKAKHAFNYNEKLRDRVEKRNKLIKNYEIKKVSEIHDKAVELVGLTFFTNFGSWLPLLSPLLVIAALTQAIKRRFKTLTERLVLTKENEIPELYAGQVSHLYSY